MTDALFFPTEATLRLASFTILDVVKTNLRGAKGDRLLLDWVEVSL
jgi:hypothetical protein